MIISLFHFLFRSAQHQLSNNLLENDEQLCWTDPPIQINVCFFEEPLKVTICHSSIDPESTEGFCHGKGYLLDVKVPISILIVFVEGGSDELLQILVCYVVCHWVII